MKTKILNALKTEYAKTTGLSDSAFNGVAAFLEKTITDESVIPTRIKDADIIALVKSFQSESDRLRTEKSAIEKALEEYKKSHPDQTPPPAPKTEEDSEVMKLLKQIQADNESLKAKYAESEKRLKNEGLMKAVRDALKKDERGDEALLDIVLSNPSIADEDTVETLTERYKGEYDTKYKALYGDGAVPPVGGGNKPEPYKMGQFSGVVSALQERGDLPKD